MASYDANIRIGVIGAQEVSKLETSISRLEAKLRKPLQLNLVGAATTNLDAISGRVQKAERQLNKANLADQKELNAAVKNVVVAKDQQARSERRISQALAEQTDELRKQRGLQAQAVRDREVAARQERVRAGRSLQQKPFASSKAGGAISSGLVGGGFPLLFGQGIGAAAGGGIGGVAGGALGGGFGFGASIVGTIIGDAVDQLKANLVELGKSLKEPTAALEAMRTAGLKVSDDLDFLVKNMVASGNAIGAQGAVIAELKRQLGAGGAEQVFALTSEQKKLDDQMSKLAATIAKEALPALVQITAGFAGIVEFALAFAKNPAVKALSDALGLLPGASAASEVFKQLQRAGAERAKGAKPAALTREQQFTAESTRIDRDRKLQDQAQSNTQAEVGFTRQRQDIEFQIADQRRAEADYERDVAAFRDDTEKRIAQMRNDASRAELEVTKARNDVASAQVGNQFDSLINNAGTDKERQILEAGKQYLQSKIAQETQLLSRQLETELAISNLKRAQTEFERETQRRADALTRQQDQIVRQRLQVERTIEDYKVQVADYQLKVAREIQDTQRQAMSVQDGSGGYATRTLGSTAYGAEIQAAAKKNNIDPALLAGLVQTESNFNPYARSGAGAIGLGQLMPGTARELGVNPNDPAENLMGAAKYLRQQIEKFGSVEAGLRAYNQGPGNQQRYPGGVSAEARQYPGKVLANAGRFGYGTASATGEMVSKEVLRKWLISQGMGRTSGDFTNKGHRTHNHMLNAMDMGFTDSKYDSNYVQKTKEMEARLRATGAFGDQLFGPTSDPKGHATHLHVPTPGGKVKMTPQLRALISGTAGGAIPMPKSPELPGAPKLSPVPGMAGAGEAETNRMLASQQQALTLAKQLKDANMEGAKARVLEALRTEDLVQAKTDELTVVKAVGAAMDDSNTTEAEINKLVAQRTQEAKNEEESIKRAGKILIEQKVITEGELNAALDANKKSRAESLAIEQQITRESIDQARALEQKGNVDQARTGTLDRQAELDMLRGGRDSLTEVERAELRYRQKDLINGPADPAELQFRAQELEAAKVNDLLDEQIRKQEQVNQLYQQIGQTIASGMTQAITGLIDGSKSLNDVLSETLAQIGQILIQQAIAQSLGYAGNQGGILGSLFRGFRAGGGDVASGKSYIVGEQGPELFVPGVSGNIIPSSDVIPTLQDAADGADGADGYDAIGGARSALRSSMAGLRGSDGQDGVVGAARAALQRSMGGMSSSETYNEMMSERSSSNSTVKIETIKVGDLDVVTVDQLNVGMAEATKRGAKQGEASMLKRMKNNVSIPGLR